MQKFLKHEWTSKNIPRQERVPTKLHRSFVKPLALCKSMVDYAYAYQSGLELHCWVVKHSNCNQSDSTEQNWSFGVRCGSRTSNSTSALPTQWYMMALLYKWLRLRRNGWPAALHTIYCIPLNQVNSVLGLHTASNSRKQKQTPHTGLIVSDTPHWGGSQSRIDNHQSAILLIHKGKKVSK